MLLFEEPIQLRAIGRVGQGASWDAGKAAIDQRLGRAAGAVRVDRRGKGTPVAGWSASKRDPSSRWS